MRTAALVGMRRVDRLALLPPLRFAQRLRRASWTTSRGGRFRIAPASDGAAHKQLYWPDTNVLITRFLSPDGVGEIDDFMPVGGGGDHDGAISWSAGCGWCAAR